MNLFVSSDNLIYLLGLFDQTSGQYVENATVTAQLFTPAPIALLTSSGTTATASCPNHGYTTGDTVLVQDVYPVGFQGTFVVTVLDPNTFSYTLPGLGLNNQSGTGRRMMSYKAVTGGAVSLAFVPGPVVLNGQKWPDGNYRGEIDHSLSIQPGLVYMGQVTALTPSGGQLFKQVRISALYDSQV